MCSSMMQQQHPPHHQQQRTSTAAATWRPTSPFEYAAANDPSNAHATSSRCNGSSSPGLSSSSSSPSSSTTATTPAITTSPSSSFSPSLSPSTSSSKIISSGSNTGTSFDDADSSLRSVTSTSKSTIASGASSSSSSPSSSSSNTIMLATRSRHHARSFSAEKRFETQERVAAAAAAKQQQLQKSNSASGLVSVHQTPALSDSASSMSTPANMAPAPMAAPAVTPSGLTSSSSAPAGQQLPVRARRSPSIEASASNPVLVQSTVKSTTPAAAVTSNDAIASESSTNSAAPSSSKQQASEGSPKQKEATPAEQREQDQLAKLRLAQYNRRPRVMRMTPAFSSLPNRIELEGASKKNVALPSSEQPEGQASSSNIFAFPAKKSDVVGKTTAQGSAADGDPPQGLQIDLACIPSPSLEDLQGPVTTSRLELRDRKGRPIKPSLKAPRSSVSHFLPGRTSRSDSTPAIPSLNLSSKSVPTTPTVPKNVHFDSQLEHVKVFKFKQRPTAVSRDGSPEQTETETEEEKDMFPYIWKRNGASPPNDNSPTSPIRSKITPEPVEEQLVLRLPNFPSSTRLSVDRPVFLERIFLADDLRSVKGTVQVRNMSFEKWVAVRYTLDHWATIGEVSAEYSESIKGGQADRFCFSIKLNELLNWPRGSAAHETKSMFLCLRYTANATEFWDNNEGQNYQLDFRRRPMPLTPASTPMATFNAPPRANVPDSVSSLTAQNASRARVIELARRGVGGKGVFAMEELKRQLEMLRSDDEEEMILQQPIISSNESFRRRTSPPHSPGGTARSSSPSVWTARYDFGTSLRNSRSSGRSNSQGRAAALDYFSARPSGSPLMQNQDLSTSASSTQSSNGVTPSLTFSAASPPSKQKDMQDEIGRATMPSFDARFGMISPGLGDENFEHMPVSNVFSTSNTPSPSATPTLASHPLHSPERFNTFPPKRHSHSTGYPISGSTTPTGPGRLSPSASRTSLDMLRSASQSPIVTSNAALPRHDKDGSASSSTSTDASSQSSPRSSPPSDGGSPNPFSPSVSISSVESDSTIAKLSSVSNQKNSAAGPRAAAKMIDQQEQTYALQHDTSSDKPTPSSLLLSTPSGQPLSSGIGGGSTTSLNSVVSSNSASSASDDATLTDQRLRPASMSDYQELVNRFCWNNDLVPSGGSMVPDMPMNGGMGKPSAFIDGQPHAHPFHVRLDTDQSATPTTLSPPMPITSPSLGGMGSTGRVGGGGSSNEGSSGASTPTRLR